MAGCFGISIAYTNLAGYSHGYAVTTPSGDEIRRVITRGTYRRELATSISTKFNGATIESYSYAYDALSRPTTRNSDSFSYNERGEVVFSRRDAENAEDAYAYDGIGNLQIASFNFVTNTYSANNLNQYTSILRDPATPREISHDLDGNMISDGVFTYAYDSENRLATVSSASLTNGAVRVSNAYDYRNRRIGKIVQRYADGGWHATELRTFVYDGWNLIHETVATISGATTNITEIQYFWGTDLSETLQGAGGIGGLLAVSINGDFYFPSMDNNGNITKYIDENGNVVATYEYDAFGRTISQIGSMADIFRHRFSTKYFDTETGFYYYGYRFYHPVLMRWLNRDPILETGGVNLYAFCDNNPINRYDANGQSWLYCFGDCVEEWRLDWGRIFTALNAASSLNMPVAKTAAERRWIDNGVSDKTTNLSRAISQGEHLARKLPLGNPVRSKLMQSLGNLRRALRSPSLIKAGHVGAALTIFEGFYDIGVMTYCSMHCCGGD